MRILLGLIIGLFLLTGCDDVSYTGQVVIDTAVEDEPTPQEQETVIIQKTPTEPIIEEPETLTEEPPEENIYEPPQQTETTYTGTVIVKTGPSSYRVRLDNGREMRILSRQQLRTEDKIRFTLDEEGLVTSLTIIQAAPTY